MACVPACFTSSWTGLSSLLFAIVVFPIIELRGAIVTDSFVDAVAQIESSGGRFTIGDNGQANGAWQMHAPAWKDVSAYRERKGLQVWSYAHAHDPAVARLYARDYLTILENQLRAALQREPTGELVYAAYNMGFSRFRSIGFQLEKAPRATQAACARITPLIAQFERTTDKVFVRAKAES
jgi:hypothetical protein